MTARRSRRTTSAAVFNESVDSTGLQIGGSIATDDLEHFGRSGLLLSDSRSSLISRAFSMAMTACAAKFDTSSTCLSVNGRTSLR